MKFRIKTEGLAGDQLKAAEDLNRILEGMPEPVTKEEMGEAVTAAIKDLPTAANITEIKNILAEQGRLIEEMKGAEPAKPVSLAKELAKNKEKLKSIAKGMTTEEVIVPDVRKTLVQRSAVATNELNIDLPDVGQLAHRKLSLYDIFRKIPVAQGTHNGTIRYYDWDEDTIARAAAAVAEGAAFPESTAKWKKGTISLKKIGDTLPVTEEFFEDEQMFATELAMFLETNVELEIDRQLYASTGSGNEITGLQASINEWNVLSAGIESPTIYDAIVKMKESIVKTGGSKYNPDVVIMNLTTINRYKLAKDANENYIIPPFVSRDGTVVDGVVVIESNIFANNVMTMCDRRFARLYEMGGIELSRGLVNAQFTEDEMTLKARKRLAFLIRTADKGGFLKCTDITAALVELGDAISS